MTYNLNETDYYKDANKFKETILKLDKGVSNAKIDEGDKVKKEKL
jgi:hypothetical protein